MTPLHDYGSRSTPTTLTVQPVSGNFSSPTPVSAVLIDTSTDTPISGEQVTFTLNGAETCTATTDSTGTATCVITPSEPSQSYTLTASFSGDHHDVDADRIDQLLEHFPGDSRHHLTRTYTGPTTAVNGSPVTLSRHPHQRQPVHGKPPGQSGGDVHRSGSTRPVTERLA